MKFFNRSNKGNNKVPKEIKEYYDSEHRDRVGLAWLVAFVSLVVTVLVVIGIYLGGRWIYRKVAGTDSKSTSTSEVTSKDDKTSTNKSKDSASENSNKSDDKSSSSANTPSELPANSADASTSSNSASSGKNGELTNTGPGNTLVVFTVASVIAAFGHDLYQRKFKLARQK